MDLTAPAAVGGHRLAWAELPRSVRVELERAVGSPVVAADSREGGFSPALASVLTLADGRTVFAKAISRIRSDFTVTAIRREIEVLGALPPEVPAPRPEWHYDDGEWVVMVTGAVDGRTPYQPWRHHELRRFLDAATVLADSLTPAPIPAERLAGRVEEFTRWAQLADDVDLAARLEEAAPGTRVDELIRLEALWPAAVDGRSLLHGDLRADNFLLTATGFVVVDWPAVCLGAPWCDLCYALPSVAMYGGGDPDRWWRAHPMSGGVDDEAVDAALAGAAGFFVYRSLEPPVPLIPTVRAFQWAQGVATLRWLAGRRGWR